MITERKPEGRFARAAVAIVLTATALAVACETPTPSAVQQELDAVAAPAAIVEGSEKDGFEFGADTPDENRPLIFVDGELFDGTYLDKLDPDRIERVEVLKGAEAIEAYGERGANGIILISLMRDAEVAPSPPDVSDGPMFTPMTVRPEITNVNAVIQAMEQAYPQQLRDAGIGGRVVVWFFITETGNVADTRISQTSGSPALDEAALSVASLYEFTPALNRETAVPVWVQFPITFQVR